jgi:hypothetical protein
MGEQVRLAGFDPAQPAPCSLCVSPKSFVFPLCPAHDKWIYCAQCPAKRRTMKTPVIVDPANKSRPCPLGDFLQVEIVAMMQLPATHVFAHRLGRFVADRRGETDEQLSSAIHRLSGSKRKAQKIEALLRITVRSVRVFAVHNLRLLRMQFQLTRRKSRFQRLPQ